MSPTASLCRRPAAAALLIVALVATLLAVGEASAQSTRSTHGPHVLERATLDRWVHEGQHPAFVAFDSTHASLVIRGSVSASGRRTLIIGDDARLELDAMNRPRSIRIEGRSHTYDEFRNSPREQAERGRGALRGSGATLSLPFTSLREIPFAMPATPLRIGSQWSDTVSFETHAEGMAEWLDGIWNHSVVGDTIVNGRSLPLVVTTGELRYRARELTADEAIDTVLVVTRDVAGTMHGRAAVDTMLGIRAAGVDSTLLVGAAVLRMGDGPPLESGIRYDRRRTWLLSDSVVWARRDSLQAVSRSQRTGMLWLPRTPLEERVRAGDAVAIDSLIEEWRVGEHPNERRRIEMLLQIFRGADAASGSLRLLRRELGDTATIVREELADVGRPLPDTDVLPYLADPERLWKLGMLPRWTYKQLGTQLMRASPIVEPDTTRWPCTPAACAAWLALLDADVETRLRDVALAGAFARDPARWWQRVRARADAGSLIAAEAAQLGAGVGATWPAASKRPVPEPGATWRDWLDWMGGSVRWSDRHSHALRVYTARTGRDPVQELRGAWPPAGDSATLVIGTVLRRSGALGPRTADEIAAAVLHGTDAERQSAREELSRAMYEHEQPAPASLAAALLRPFVDSLASGGESPWPPIQGAVPRFTQGFHGIDDVPVFVLADSVPPEVALATPAGFTSITREEWDARPLREGGVLITIRTVTAWDRFARITQSWTAYQRRSADQAPGGYAGGETLILLRTEEGWRLVSSLAWIT